MKKEITSVVIIIAIFVVAIVRIFDHSDIILHWDFVGDADSWENCLLMLILPMVSVGVYFFLKYFERHPSKCNIPFRVVNKDAVYPIIVRSMYRARQIILLMFLYITVCSAGYLDLNALIVNAFVVLALGMVIRSEVKALKVNHRK